jgi:hypothetical protein
MSIVRVQTHFSWGARAVPASWPVDWIDVSLVWRTRIANQGNPTTIQNIVPPKCLSGTSGHMWIVPHRVNTARILRRNTTAQTFPCIAIWEMCTVRFDKDEMCPGIYAGRIWCRWSTDELHSNNHMFPIRCEVASLEGV